MKAGRRNFNGLPYRMLQFFLPRQKKGADVFAFI